MVSFSMYAIGCLAYLWVSNVNNLFKTALWHNLEALEPCCISGARSLASSRAWRAARLLGNYFGWNLTLVRPQSVTGEFDNSLVSSPIWHQQSVASGLERSQQSVVCSSWCYEGYMGHLTKWWLYNGLLIHSFIARNELLRSNASGGLWVGLSC